MIARRLPLLIAFLVAAALMVWYSQTQAFAWDEGFHVLAAQLILRGKRPYIDFCFSQTPLNAYWNAALMRWFGESWRPLHASAAICSAVASYLIAEFIGKRFPFVRWRATAEFLALILVAGNIEVVRFGAIAQAYGLALLAIVAAFRFAVMVPDSRRSFTSALAGLASGIATGSTLLTAPAALVVMLWIAFSNRRGSRNLKCLAFLTGAATAFLPVISLFVQSPAHVVFGIFDYNFRYRLLNWPGATVHNWQVYSSWIDNGPALVILVLSVGGVVWLRSSKDCTPAFKSELYLCAWLVAAMSALLCYTKPTFARYFIFVVPFLAVLAVVGLYAAAGIFNKTEKPWIIATALSLFLLIGLARDLYAVIGNVVWPDLEPVAHKVLQLADEHSQVYADEAIYFLTKLPPPSGFEMDDSHKFNFSPQKSAYLHVISSDEVKRETKAGRWDVIQTCEEDEYIDEHGFKQLFNKNASVEFCDVFWDRKTVTTKP